MATDHDDESIFLSDGTVNMADITDYFELTLPPTDKPAIISAIKHDEDTHLKVSGERQQKQIALFRQQYPAFQKNVAKFVASVTKGYANNETPGEMFKLLKSAYFLKALEFNGTDELIESIEKLVPQVKKLLITNDRWAEKQNKPRVPLHVWAQLERLAGDEKKIAAGGPDSAEDAKYAANAPTAADGWQEFVNQQRQYYKLTAHDL